MKRKLLYVFIAIAAIITSCKKEETTVTTPTAKELLTSHAWQLNSYTTAATDQATLDTLTAWNKTLPITVSYSTNGTYVYSDSSDYGSWELQSDNKTIVYGKGTADQYSGTIQTLTSTDFVLSYSWKINETTTSTLVETCKKK